MRSIGVALAIMIASAFQARAAEGTNVSGNAMALDAMGQYWKQQQKFFLIVTADQFLNPAADLTFAAVDGVRVEGLLTNLGYVKIANFAGPAANRTNFIKALGVIQTLGEQDLVVIYYS